MAYSYLDEEITRPEGVSADDLNWMLFTWSMTPRGADRTVVHPVKQFLLAPGMIMLHNGTSDEVGKMVGDAEIPGSVSHIAQLDNSDSMVLEADEQIRIYQTLDWEVSTDLMAVSVNPGDFPEWSDLYSITDTKGEVVYRKVETLGDALAYNQDEGSVKDVLNLICAARIEAALASTATRMEAMMSLHRKAMEAADESVTRMGSSMFESLSRPFPSV